MNLLRKALLILAGIALLVFLIGVLQSMYYFAVQELGGSTFPALVRPQEK
jgi:hypothetical protein